MENPTQWLVNKSWIDVVSLAKLPKFVGFEKDFAANVDAWRGWGGGIVF
jgi:hypothetical protein